MLQLGEMLKNEDEIPLRRLTPSADDVTMGPSISSARDHDQNIKQNHDISYSNTDFLPSSSQTR